MTTADDLDAVWHALGNPLRRRMVDALHDGPRTTGELAAAFPEVSRFAVMQHLDVLVAAELVVVRREGRERWNYLNAVPIRRIYERWVSRYEDLWAGELVSLQRSAEAGATLVPRTPPPTEEKARVRKAAHRQDVRC